MLERLLDLVREGGTRRVIDLARALDTTPQLVEAMLEDLVRMGHLKKVEGRCADSCTSCSLASQCAAGERGEVWSLSERR